MTPNQIVLQGKSASACLGMRRFSMKIVRTNDLIADGREDVTPLPNTKPRQNTTYSSPFNWEFRGRMQQ
jgi:hypothetical protein